MSNKQTCFVTNEDNSISMLWDGDPARNQTVIFSNAGLSHSQAREVVNILDLAYRTGRKDLARAFRNLIGVTKP